MTFRNVFVKLGAAVLALIVLTQPAAAQILYGSIVGNVKDPSDAAVAGARVVAINKQTNVARETITSDIGAYSFPTIQAGTYAVTVTREGFRTATSEVTVSINSVIRADVTLQLGAVAETVEVNAATQVLQTDRSEVRAEITSQTFQNLPVPLGRNYQQLFKIVPGFRPPTNAHSVPTNPARALTFNVNGVSYSINNTRIDGASSIAPWLPHATAFVPTLESIDAVNIVTNSFDAEQGLAGGAAVNVQIRSGTNDLHGSAFEYHTNQALKAKPWILPAGSRKPKLVNNEFGGTLGGPVKKDRLFYFMSYEGTYNREFASRLGTVPTPLTKQGIMSETPRLVYDPASTTLTNGTGRTPFPNNTIPANRISPIIKKLVDLTPNPNQTGLTNNYFAGGSYIFDRHRADTKVNWNPSSNFTMFSRFSLLHYDMDNAQMFGALGGPEISAAGGNPGVGTGNTFSWTLAGTYIFSPRLIIDAYYGWTRMDTSVEQGRLDEKLGLDFLGIPGTNGSRRFEGGWPQFAVASYTQLGVPNAFQPYFRRDPQSQYVANLNWTKGAHEVRFGVDIYFSGMNHLQPEATGASHGAQGGFNFGGGPTVLAGGATADQFNNYSTFLLGLPTNVGKITQVPDEYNTRQSNYSMYVRDRWNVSRKLTLSYGLRWEYYPYPTRADRGLEFYDGAINKMLVCGAGSIPQDCGATVSKKLFAPRIGFAYRVTDTFVVRAGYGITYDPFSLQRPLRTNYPVLLIQNITPANASFGWVSPIAQGIPPVTVPSTSAGVLDVPSTFAVVTTQKDTQRGYVQSWNFTVQKQLPFGLSGQAGYVATRSVRQIGYLDINSGQVIGADNAGRPLQQLFGRSAPTTLITPFGTTQYNSLQSTLDRRFSKGFSMGVTYTWSKVIGPADNSDSGPSVQALRFFTRNRVVRGYDRTHNFNVTQIIELPFGPGKKWANDGVAGAILGGWQLNNLISLYSGTPFTVGSGGGLRMPGSTQTADQVTPEVKILGGTGRGQNWFDPLAFAAVPTTLGQERFGNTAMNILRGPGIANWDFGFFRRFNITERWKAEFRMEAFNFTNTPHFNNPGANVSSFNPSVTDPLTRFNGYSEITGVGTTGRDGIDERQFRFGLRISF